MMPTAAGSIRLFQAWGITVFLHWSWFLVAVFEFNDRGGRYQSRVWHFAEYLSLFAIVLMHEFGHSLACRQVGGKADQIVLWPFGGVAYVDPPPRPGATLWSIVAGPLVNVVLFFVLTAIAMVVGVDFLEVLKSGKAAEDHLTWLFWMWMINLLLLIFNMLPVYPLDGGQILRALLWFPLGRAKSLLVATIMGLLGVAMLIALAVWQQNVWMIVLCGFILMNCWRGLQMAFLLLKLERLPRHSRFACPHCLESPPAGSFWGCGRCGTGFDIFASGAICPRCAATFQEVRCIHCGKNSPLLQWTAVTVPTNDS